MLDPTFQFQGQAAEVAEVQAGVARLGSAVRLAARKLQEADAFDGDLQLGERGLKIHAVVLDRSQLAGNLVLVAQDQQIFRHVGGGGGGVIQAAVPAGHLDIADFDGVVALLEARSEPVSTLA